MSKKTRSSRQQAESDASPSKSQHGKFVAVRETIESIVVAFVLAFLFRTFEAEAFVIPTGSMSPALQGRHKDVDCDQCGYRFRTTASTEESDLVLRWQQELWNPRLSLDQRSHLRNMIRSQDIVAGDCPMCRYTMPFRKDIPMAVQEYVDLDQIEEQPSYPGDRILVNKYGFDMSDPERWDVVVFKFPGNGSMNYIKRLVGLPGETLRVYQGDLFAKAEGEAEFQIQRKPPAKVHAMLQPVHDTDYEPTSLHRAGWPLRWAATTTKEGAGGWQIEAEPGEQTVQQHFKFGSADSASPESPSLEPQPVAWLRYRHLVPESYDWQEVRQFHTTGAYPNNLTKEQWVAGIDAQLIVDYNAYNARILRGHAQQGVWQVDSVHWPANWVGDLAVECHVEVSEPTGKLVLDLVEGGKHFSCHIDLSTGDATLGIEGQSDFQPGAKTSVHGSGDYRLLFANVDDQLLLWVDDDLIEFEDSTYDADQVFGKRADVIPRSDEIDPGDLAPAGVGARGTSLTVNRLRVLRDIYYVAAKWSDNQRDPEYTRIDMPAQLTDGTTLPSVESRHDLLSNPKTWPRFGTRRKHEFPISSEQFFVCGDNSPESADCRLWFHSSREKGIPGGAYLDRRLITGKAICVFWPHSWGGIPGLKKLPGFPNFGDMRIVR